MFIAHPVKNAGEGGSSKERDFKEEDQGRGAGLEYC